MNSISKVYIVLYNNMEQWSDYLEWVGEVFDCEQKAIDMLMEEGFEEHPFNNTKYYVLHIDDYNSISASILERGLR